MMSKDNYKRVIFLLLLIICILLFYIIHANIKISNIEDALENQLNINEYIFNIIESVD